MAYLTSNPPAAQRDSGLVSFGAAAGAGGRQWIYKSTDAVATVQGANYFSNGSALGMEVGDIVWVHQTNAAPYKITGCIVTSVVAGGAASLGTTSVITLQ